MLTDDACGEGAFATFSLIDVPTCVFAREQLHALAMQRHPRWYTAATYAGILLPSPARLALGREVGLRIGRVAGSGSFSRALTTGSLEAFETAIWSLNTSPPGVPLAERLSGAARDGALAAGLGFAAETLLRGRP